MVVLVDLVGREVGDIDVGVELGFEGSADLAELVPDDASEEWVILDLLGSTCTSETIGRITEHTK